MRNVSIIVLLIQKNAGSLFICVFMAVLPFPIWQHRSHVASAMNSAFCDVLVTALLSVSLILLCSTCSTFLPALWITFLDYCFWLDSFVDCVSVFVVFDHILPFKFKTSSKCGFISAIIS